MEFEPLTVRWKIYKGLIFVILSLPLWLVTCILDDTSVTGQRYQCNYHVRSRKMITSPEFLWLFLGINQ